MALLQKVRQHREKEAAPPPETPAAPTEKVEKLKAELDDLLDEIDEVLETNAAEFVAAFIQKGGQ